MNNAMISFDTLRSRKSSIAIVGLGYVGLPLAVRLSEHFAVIGFDVSQTRIKELQSGKDFTHEVDDASLFSATIEFTTYPADLSRAGVIIVAVPTPIDVYRRPDLAILENASAMIGKHLSRGSVIVFESTVYPGLTEDVCVPLLEENSGLKNGVDFWVGYSPERVNPGDKQHTISSIVKVVAGQDKATGDLLEAIYGKVVNAGIYRASSIKVAEAAKVIENTQRDLNIALMNELALIFERLEIDTLEVLEAAGTKWNFLKFHPGLVGGHCIGVDPYYLTFKAEALGLHPQVILAGRHINDFMGKHVAAVAIKQLAKHGVAISHARVAVLGVTFKENVPDMRNTRVVDVINELHEYSVNAIVHDPIVNTDEAVHELGIVLCTASELEQLDAIILCAPHDFYTSLPNSTIMSWFADPQKAIILDVLGRLDKTSLSASGAHYWRL